MSWLTSLATGNPFQALAKLPDSDISVTTAARPPIKLHDDAWLSILELVPTHVWSQLACCSKQLRRLSTLPTAWKHRELVLNWNSYKISSLSSSFKLAVGAFEAKDYCRPEFGRYPKQLYPVVQESWCRVAASWLRFYTDLQAAPQAFEHLSSLKNLRQLALVGGHQFSRESGLNDVLASALQQLTKLRELTLHCSIIEDRIAHLMRPVATQVAELSSMFAAVMPQLEKLTLVVAAADGSGNVASICEVPVLHALADALPIAENLVELSIVQQHSSATIVAGVKFSKGCVTALATALQNTPPPNLQLLYLHIRNCEGLEELYRAGLEISSLNEFEIAIAADDHDHLVRLSQLPKKKNCQLPPIEKITIHTDYEAIATAIGALLHHRAARSVSLVPLRVPCHMNVAQVTGEQWVRCLWDMVDALVKPKMGIFLEDLKELDLSRIWIKFPTWATPGISRLHSFMHIQLHRLLEAVPNLRAITLPGNYGIYSALLIETPYYDLMHLMDDSESMDEDSAPSPLVRDHVFFAPALPDSLPGGLIRSAEPELDSSPPSDDDDDYYDYRSYSDDDDDDDEYGAPVRTVRRTGSILW
jgi:hypothetical protein